MQRNREEDCNGRQADRSREGGVYVSIGDQGIAAYADDAVTRPGDRLSRSQADDWLIERSGEAGAFEAGRRWRSSPRYLWFRLIDVLSIQGKRWPALWIVTLF